MKINFFHVLCDDFPLENVREVMDPTIRFVPEVVQMSEFISVAPTEIKDNAFVFKTDVLSLAPQYHAVQSISNVFQLRYRSNNSKIPNSKCLAFASSYESFTLLYFGLLHSSHIGSNLKLIHEGMNIILGCYAMSQGESSKGKGKVTVSKEALQYILRRVSPVIGGDKEQKVNTHSSKRIKRLLQPGLVLSSHCVVYQLGSFLRFQTTLQLCALVELFGETILCNVRKRRPRLSTLVNLGKNDRINVIVEALCRESPFQF
jgi:hypothetical protein